MPKDKRVPLCFVQKGVHILFCKDLFSFFANIFLGLQKISDYLFLTLTEIQEIKKTSPLPSIYQDRTFNTCGTEPNSVRLCDEQMKSHHM